MPRYKRKSSDPVGDIERTRRNVLHNISTIMDVYRENFSEDLSEKEQLKGEKNYKVAMSIVGDRMKRAAEAISRYPDNQVSIRNLNIALEEYDEVFWLWLSKHLNKILLSTKDARKKKAMTLINILHKQIRQEVIDLMCKL